MASRDDLLASPAEANALAEAAVKAAQAVEAPTIPAPPSDHVVLPGGLVRNGEVTRRVQVRELTGEHEEALARAMTPPAGATEVNWAHFLQVLLECGVKQVGDFPESQTKDLLRDMITGDRDAVVMGIRQATYDDDLELIGWTCPYCGKSTDITLSLAQDVPVTKMDDPLHAQTFTVKLRRGRVATVRLATGRDEAAMFDVERLTQAERESVMLSRCLLKIADASGQETIVAGFSKSIVQNLSIPDRKAIIRDMNKRQPGPRYNEITFVHQDCQKEVPLVIGLGTLFPDLF